MAKNRKKIQRFFGELPFDLFPRPVITTKTQIWELKKFFNYARELNRV